MQPDKKKIKGGVQMEKVLLIKSFKLVELTYHKSVKRNVACVILYQEPQLFSMPQKEIGMMATFPYSLCLFINV